MVRYLSPEWIEALDRAAADAPAPLTDGALVVQQTVTDDSGEPDVTWHVALDGTGVRVRPGPAPTDIDAAVVRFRTDRTTAVAVLDGALAAQAAFMRGDLQVGGDTGALVERAEALAALDDLFAAVRRDTEH